MTPHSARTSRASNASNASNAVGLADQLEAAGLTGRGGAAFPTSVKLRAALAHGADLIVNACDGELGATKDAWVVTHHLDEVVEGARLLTSAGRGRRRVRYAVHRGSAAEAHLRSRGVDVLDVPARYVSSEETALISLAQGGLARPMTKKAPFVTGGRDSEGRRIDPTLVLNAETVWRVAQIATQGPEWFRGFGTPEEPGPRLVSVGGAVRAPMLLHASAGVTFHDLLEGAGGPRHGVQAVLVGGLGGGFLHLGEASARRWAKADLAPLGVPLGPGVVTLVDPTIPFVEYVSRQLHWAAGESAGQCGPCMFGLPALAESWAAMARGHRGAREQVERRLALLPDRGACRFPDGLARYAATALRVLDLTTGARPRTGAPR